MARRSHIENRDLEFTVRLNGRVFGAFRRMHWAEDFAHQAARDYPDATVELEDLYDTVLKLGPSIKECA